MLDSLSSKLSLYEKHYIANQIKLIKDGNTDFDLLKDLKTERDSVLYFLTKADKKIYDSYYTKDSTNFNLYSKAVRKAVKLKDTALICESSKKILTFLSQGRLVNVDTQFTYLNIYKSYLYDLNEEMYYLFSKIILETLSENKSPVDDLKKGLLKSKEVNNPFLESKYHHMIGLFYDYFEKNTDSAIYHFKKTEKLLNSKNYAFFHSDLVTVYGNIGIQYGNKKKYKLERKYYLKAYNVNLIKNKFLVKHKLNNLLSENSKRLNNYKSAVKHLEKANKYRDSLEEVKTAKSFEDIQLKYETEKKEKENLLLKQKNYENEIKQKQSKNLLLASLIFIISVGLSALLVIKNINKKRLLAEKQSDLNKQKNITLLREQEINTINAMVEGQEKERKQIAEDLHDNIGSVLATLKLNFENLKLNHQKKQFDQKELYEKTEKLIDETYLKIRGIAHAKNSGVIANKGLLPAIKTMAEKVSSANKIDIEISDYGLDNRIDNSIELTIFRIIQELITNIIKHAEATIATISMSQFNKELNIIVEDNGKGFNVSSKNLNLGMGLNSIQKRIEHLNGIFEIDSTINRGTSIIISVPL